jgi:membrane fusion protein, multidrug efflux system
MNMNQTKYALISILISSIIALTGCRYNEVVKADDTRGRESNPAATSPPSAAVESTAVIVAKRNGIVIWLIGQEGTPVDKGQVIAVLNDDESLARLRQAELEVERMKAEELQCESLVKVNQVELQRLRTLFKDGIVSRRDLDQAQYKFDSARQELEKTRLAIRIAEARVDVAKMESDKANIRAPIAGIITRSYIKLAASVAQGDKLIEVSQLTPL